MNNDFLIHLRVDKCHVSQSNLSVIRSFLTTVRTGRRQWFTIPRSKRHNMLRKIIKRHKENRNLYQAVMSGNI